MLAALSERPSIVFTRRQLINHVWGPAWLGDGACSTFASGVYDKDRTGFAKALKPIYTAADAAAAQPEFDTFRDSVWGTKYPHAVGTRQAAWERVTPFLGSPPELRRGPDIRHLGLTLPARRVGRRGAQGRPDAGQTEKTLQSTPAPMPSARLRAAVATAVVADQVAGMNAPGRVRAGGSPRPYTGAIHRR